MKKTFHRPLGEVLHTIGKEAICKPITGFKGRGWRVMIDDEIVGELGDPFGNIDHPYQPIILKPHVRDKDFKGKSAFDLPKKKNRKHKNKNRSKRRVKGNS